MRKYRSSIYILVFSSQTEHTDRLESILCSRIFIEHDIAIIKILVLPGI